MRKRLLSVLLGAAMTVTAMGGVTVMAAENEEPLPGGGSNIIYVITPSVSNPAFKTEADVATKTAEELGYEVKAASMTTILQNRQSFLTALSLTKQQRSSAIMQVRTLPLKLLKRQKTRESPPSLLTVRSTKTA